MKITFETIYVVASKRMNPAEIRHYRNGYPLENLCLKVNRVSIKLIKELKFVHNGFPVMMFRDKNGELWFDIPFAYPANR